MSLPYWLFDELADHIADAVELRAVLTAWNELLADSEEIDPRAIVAVVGELLVDDDGAVIWVPPRPSRREQMEARACAEHEAVNDAPCECRVPRWSAVPDRCGACIGRLPDDQEWTADRSDDWLGDPARPDRDPPARRGPTYDEVVADFKARPLAPGETDEDRLRRAGGRDFPPAIEEGEG